jgi:hypothetical protein
MAAPITNTADREATWQLEAAAGNVFTPIKCVDSKRKL